MEHYRLEDLDVDPTISVDTADETDAYYLAVDLLSMLGFPMQPFLKIICISNLGGLMIHDSLPLQQVCLSPEF